MKEEERGVPRWAVGPPRRGAATMLLELSQEL